MKAGSSSPIWEMNTFPYFPEPAMIPFRLDFEGSSLFKIFNNQEACQGLKGGNIILVIRSYNEAA
jgi:hypothetical protein